MHIDELARQQDSPMKLLLVLNALHKLNEDFDEPDTWKNFKNPELVIKDFERLIRFGFIELDYLSIKSGDSKDAILVVIKITGDDNILYLEDSSQIDLCLDKWPKSLALEFVNMLNRLIPDDDIKQLNEFILQPLKLIIPPSTTNTKLIIKNKNNLAFYIVETFYTELNKIFPITLTKSLKTREVEYAKKLVEEYPEFSDEDFKNGIRFFFEDSWWKDKMTSVKMLHNNYSKYLINKQKKAKKKTTTGLNFK